MGLSQFKCLDLQAIKKPSVEELGAVIDESQRKPGAYVCYGNGSWFEDDSSSTLLQEIRDALKIKKAIELKPLFGRSDSRIELSSGVYHIPNQVFNHSSDTQNAEVFSFLQALPGAVRIATLDGTFDEAPFFLLAPPICHDFFNSTFESPLLSLANAYEYLLWPDDDLLEDKPINYERAWCGNGFAGWRFQQYHKKESSRFPYSSGYHESLDKTLEKLQHYERLLCTKGVYDQVHQYRRNGFLDALIDFLPAYRHKEELDTYELIAVNSRWPGEPEGPIAWKDNNILGIEYHQRQLLLDGLLTLWPVPKSEGDFLLQPASLAVMYWTVQRLQYPYSSAGADEFMKRYFDYPTDYVPSDAKTRKQRDCLGWFGGRLEVGIRHPKTESSEYLDITSPRSGSIE